VKITYVQGQRYNMNWQDQLVCQGCGHPQECHTAGHVRVGFPCECELRKVPEPQRPKSLNFRLFELVFPS
jgi:hypothetical protein